MKRNVLVLFVVVCVMELVAITWIESIEWIIKPLIMISLGAYYTTSQKNNLSKPVLAAILFSWGGDVLLMLQNQNPSFFVFGLGSFLIAHVAYIFSYRQHRYSEPLEELLGPQKIRFALPVVLFGTGLVTILYSHLGDLRIPVLLYAIAIIVMVLQALFRFGFTSAASFWSVLAGAILFMISDSLIAVTKFLTDLPYDRLTIMTSYMLAQFLIIDGLIRHK